MRVGEGEAGAGRVNHAGPSPVCEVSLASLAATGRFAARLAAAIDVAASPHGAPHDTLWIGLFGEVGAGKTTLTARLVPALQKLGWASDGAEEVASPTYAIEHLYLRGALLHADLYRLSDSRLPQLSLLDTTARAALVEWPERIGAVAELLDAELYLEVVSKQCRLVRLVGKTPRGVAMVRALAG
jgi:tRNA threonylcarbamoyl adenosine modification protein YjeE